MGNLATSNLSKAQYPEYPLSQTLVTLSVHQRRLQPLTLTDVYRLSDGITVSEWLGASLTSAIAMRSLNGCKAVICSCCWDLIGTETTSLSCLALP